MLWLNGDSCYGQVMIVTPMFTKCLPSLKNMLYLQQTWKRYDDSI